MASNNDFDDDFDDLDAGGFDDFSEGKKGSLGDLWRNSPVVKIVTLVGAAGLVFAFILWFGRDKPPEVTSVVQTGDTISEVADTGEGISEEMAEQIRLRDEQDLEAAQAEGESFIATPITRSSDNPGLPGDQAAEEDPLQRWRRLQEERLRRELQRRDTIQPEAPAELAGRQEAVQNLSDLMLDQMQAILDNQTQTSVNYVGMTAPDFLDDLREEEEAELQARAQETSAASDIQEEVIVAAGEIVYAQMITEANSDIPGPVLAQIVSGPLRGNRVIGEFSRENEFLAITFDRVIIDGIDFGIDGIALDPKTTLPGLATEVDRRYFTRVILPAAASFIEGFAGAVAETQTEVAATGDVVVEESPDLELNEEIASGIEEVGENLSEEFEDIADETEILVVVERGTPFGLLFLEALTTGDNTPDIIPVNSSAGQQIVGGNLTGQAQ